MALKGSGNGVIATGAAGFIGSHVVDQLISRGHQVLVLDNMSLGRESNLKHALASGRCKLLVADLSSYDPQLNQKIQDYFKDVPVEQVWHMAANSDIARGAEDPSVDLRDTFMTTFQTINLARNFGARDFFLASTSAVYGERQEVLREDSGPCFPISNYGAMKLASEGVVSAAKERFLDRAVIFRFPNVVGSRGTHGALYDFIQRLIKNPERLDVLGNGQQTKPYLHVSELVQAMFAVADKFEKGVECVNIGVSSGLTSVRFIAEEAVRQVSPNAQIHYGQGSKGWIGDVPKFQLSTERIGTYGWKSQLTSDEVIRKAALELVREAQGAQ